MTEQHLDIATADGSSDAVFYHPDGSGPWPGVLYLTDIGGVRHANRESAQRLAAEGYAVLMPNVFYRTARPPLWNFKPNFGEERTMKRFGELAGPLTADAAERDGVAYVKALSAQPSVAVGRIAVVGHCFTGAVALRIAAALPDSVGAVASFHGGGLFTDKPESPHHVLPRVKARLYFGHADQDRTMPAEAIMQLDKALNDWGGRFESELYAGVHHGWTVSDNPAYSAPQAERAYDKLTTLLAQTLKK